MKNWKYILLALILFPFAGMVSSCSEDSEEEGEYDDWQNRNDVVTAEWAGSSMKKIICYSKNTTISGNVADYIYVEVLESGTGIETPLFTDTCRLAYRGRLIPSKSYPEGYVFDQSYLGDFNWNTIDVARDENGRDKVCLDQDFVPGFTTALMNMHIGDRWRVYIPYQLGYGSLAKPTCSYSNLIFDVALVDFWHPGEHRPVFKSR
jgi:FKBP-type peptidyl-prolyl cis-trans isomerase FklB